MALTRWIAPAALAAALGLASFAPAAKAQSMDELTRTIVDIADVVFRGNQPYYRYGDYGADDRLVQGRDAYGRPVYYRVVDDRYGGYGYDHRGTPPYGRAYGYHNRAPGPQRVKCNKHGKCKAEYYDPRYDQRSDWDGRRWRDD